MTELYLSTPASPFFGYGVCGTYLLSEFSKRRTVHYSPIGENLPWDNSLDELIKNHTLELTSDVNAPLLQFPLDDFAPPTQYRGKPNVLYLFSEWEITEKQKENLRKYDVLIAGSEWNAQVIRDAGFECHAVPQGVDQEVFNPRPFRDGFVIFSGGKWEHRKGQDLVIKALEKFRRPFLLVSSWFNIWGGTPLRGNFPHQEHGLLNQSALCELMNMTHVGLFPNRVEGGTNLVMMEYLSCGRPVIANFGTGQRQVLDHEYALEANTVDEMVDHLEYLYQNRDKMKSMGLKAHEAMKKFTWSKTADEIERFL